MTHSIENAIASIQDKSLTAGCADAPDIAISQMGPQPFSLAYEGEARTEMISSGFMQDFPTVIVQHHVSSVILPDSIARAAALRDPFLRALRDDPTLGGTCATIVSIRRKFGEMKFGTIQTIGYQYEIGLKLFVEDAS